MTEQIPETPRRFSLFPKALSKSVEQLVKPIYKKHGFAEHRLLTEWPAIVGAELAEYSVPEKLAMRRGATGGGTLHIMVSSARALELQHMQPVILGNIEAYFGYKAVDRLAFSPTASHLFRRKSKALPPTSATLPSASLEAMVAGCTDEELRAKLLSLGAALDIQ